MNWSHVRILFKILQGQPKYMRVKPCILTMTHRAHPGGAPHCMPRPPPCFIAHTPLLWTLVTLTLTIRPFLELAVIQHLCPVSMSRSFVTTKSASPRQPPTASGDHTNARASLTTDLQELPSSNCFPGSDPALLSPARHVRLAVLTSVQAPAETDPARAAHCSLPPSGNGPGTPETLAEQTRGPGRGGHGKFIRVWILSELISFYLISLTIFRADLFYRPLADAQIRGESPQSGAHRFCDLSSQKGKRF